MNINRKYLPIKGHFFLFYGCLAPILPFMMVVARQLGISVAVQGVVGSLILMTTVIVQPLISSLADAFSSARKGILILILTLMVSSYFIIAFLPPMHGRKENTVEGTLLVTLSSSIAESCIGDECQNLLQQESNKVYLHSNDEGSCYPRELWDCIGSYESSEPIVISSMVQVERNLVQSVNTSEKTSGHIYFIRNSNVTSIPEGINLNFSCRGGIYEGKGCVSLWENPMFYAYVILLTIGYVCFATGTSFSDAICVDVIGKDGSYGKQRLWGTVGWGLMGPLGGFLVDWYSGEAFGKNYWPAFLILFVLGSIDVLLATVKLKIPRFNNDSDVFKIIKVELKKPSMVFFLFFVILLGVFDGVITSFIFVFQEEIAKGSSHMLHMKLIQGLTLGVGSCTEVPFMLISDDVFKRIGSSIMPLLFFIYAFRLVSMALVGSFGYVWATLVVELLHGPCYGLGRTAIVTKADEMSSPRISTTVQSIASICFESLGYATASFVGGFVFSVMGGSGLFYIFGALAFGSSLLYIVIHRLLFPSKQTKEVEVEAPHSPASEPLVAPPSTQREKK